MLTDLGNSGNRPCLRSHVTQYKDAGFTHIHWGFANLTEDFKPDVSGLQDEFDMFKKMTGVKKIVSFGGWAFSTEAGTWPIFKQGSSPTPTCEQKEADDYYHLIVG